MFMVMKDTATSESVSEDSWAHWLHPGETLLWHGKPVARFRFRFSNVLNTLPLLTFGVFISFIPTFGLTGLFPDLRHNSGSFLQAWFYIHLTLYGLIQIAIVVWQNKRTASAYYSLTNKRAVVGFSWPSKSSAEYDLPRPGENVFDDKVYISRSKPRSVYFAAHRPERTTFGVWTYSGFEQVTQADLTEIGTHLKQLNVPIHPKLV